jgi:hypothetical protein
MILFRCYLSRLFLGTYANKCSHLFTFCFSLKVSCLKWSVNNSTIWGVRLNRQMWIKLLIMKPITVSCWEYYCHILWRCEYWCLLKYLAKQGGWSVTSVLCVRGALCEYHWWHSLSWQIFVRKLAWVYHMHFVCVRCPVWISVVTLAVLTDFCEPVGASVTHLFCMWEVRTWFEYQWQHNVLIKCNSADYLLIGWSFSTGSSYVDPIASGNLHILSPVTWWSAVP